MRARCSSWVPCEKFRRAQSIPVAASASTTLGSEVAGPRVQTILVRRGASCVDGRVTVGQLSVSDWKLISSSSFGFMRRR